MKKTIEAYEPPMVEVIEVEVEKGFAESNEQIGIRNDEMDW